MKRPNRFQSTKVEVEGREDVLSLGTLRFYQMHVTVPGQLDAMGGSLSGFPLITSPKPLYCVVTESVVTVT